MAAPRYSLGAHDGGELLARQVQQARDTGAEFVGGHVIGITAKRSIAPASIDGILFRVTATTETLQVRVINSPLAQRGGEGVGIELRHASRFGNAAHIHKALHAMHLEDGEKLFDCAGGMPDREQDRKSTRLNSS